MSVELRIVFDGSEEALRQHRLSVHAFGKAIVQLLAALRRTASGMVGLSVGDAESDFDARGRLRPAAKAIDLELAALSDGCVDAHFVVTHNLANLQADLWADLPAEAVSRLVDDIEAEARGRPRNAAARKYLGMLPRGIMQRYTATRDGTVLRTVDVGVIDIPSVAVGGPRVLRAHAEISAICFDPDREYVAIRDGRSRVRLSATQEQINTVLSLRSQGKLHLTYLTGETARLLRVDPDVPSVDENKRLDAAAEKWADVLRRLAQ